MKKVMFARIEKCAAAAGMGLHINKITMTAMTGQIETER